MNKAERDVDYINWIRYGFSPQFPSRRSPEYVSWIRFGGTLPLPETLGQANTQTKAHQTKQSDRRGNI